jgi:F-type H+-transporting ATPase subunit delta
VSRTLIAHRYAKALLDIALQDGVLAAVRQELEEVQALVRSSADLERLVSAPLIAPSRKAAAFGAILAQVGASDLLRRFFQVVAGAARLSLFHEIVAAFHRQVDLHLGVVEAQVSSPLPLAEGQAERLSLALARRTGRTIRLALRQDPRLLGGLKVQVGSTVYDASLEGQLRQLKARLLSA